MKEMKRLIYTLITLTLITGIAIGLFVRVYFPFAGLPISSDKVDIYIKPGGNIGPDGKYLGTYWVVTTTVDTDNTYYFYFNKEESALDKNDTDGNYKIIPKAKMSFTFKPKRPYYEIPLSFEQIEVTGTVYYASSSTVSWYEGPEKTVLHTVYTPVPDISKSISPTVINAWIQSGDYIPILHTPFTLTVEITSETGVTYKEEHYIDITTNGTTFKLIDKGENKVATLIGLGQLKQGWGEPHIQPFVYFDKTNIFKLNLPAKGSRESMEITSALRKDYTAYSFSKYWFGEYGNINNYYWSYPNEKDPLHLADRTPRPKYEYVYFKEPLSEVDEGYAYKDDWYTKGWSYLKCPLCKGYAHYATPIKPDFTDVMDYLRNEGANPVDLTFGYANVNYEVKENKLYIYYPYGSCSALVQLFISTELADSYAVAIGQGTFSIKQAYWKSTGTDANNELVKDVICVDVYNSGQEATAEVRLAFSPETYKNYFQYEPYLQAIIQANDSHLFQFTVNCLGVPQDISGEITVSLYDTLFGNFYGSSKLKYTAIAGSATLKIWTEPSDLPKEPKIYVNGIEQNRSLGGYVILKLKPQDYIVSFEVLEGYAIEVLDLSTAVTQSLGNPPVKVSLLAGQTKEIKAVYSFTGETTLTIMLVEKGTTNAISGVSVVINYKSLTLTKKTDILGKCTFSLGDYSGDVSINVDTGWVSLYNSNFTSTKVLRGSNSLTIELESRYWLFTAIGCGIGVIVVVVVGIIYKRKREYGGIRYDKDFAY